MSEPSKRISYSFAVFMRVLRALKLTSLKEGGLAGNKLQIKYRLGPLGRTVRKPRTKSYDMYGSSIFSDAQSFWTPEFSPAREKIEKRIEADLCRGCGNQPEECRCKRKE